MLPFIKPIEVKQYFENTKIETYNDAIKQIISKEKIDKNKINILMAHQFVTSGTINPETSESETINIGGIDNVDASNFSEFDYVALGAYTWTTKNRKRKNTLFRNNVKIFVFRSSP